MLFQAILDFYEENKDFLLIGEGDKTIKPAQSITRNIFTSLQRFFNYYISNPKDSYTINELEENVWPTREGSVSRTTPGDNIRNMTELKFWEKKGEVYYLTRNFFDVVNNGYDLKKYIIQSLKKISDVSDMTMFLNYIMCVLREGIIYDEIISYPGSTREFVKAIPNFEIRKELCKKVYELYGFHGRNMPFGEYTPKINYRILSTCVDLNLITKDGKDKFGFQKYILTKFANEILREISKNIEESTEMPKKKIEKSVRIDKTRIDRIAEILEDWDYQEKTDETAPAIDLSNLDHPQTLPDSYRVLSSTRRIKRDPQKASNAKKMAQYKCEVDNNHHTFIGSNRILYSEAHHLIPISKQKDFHYSLDIEANIVSLCPLCHRKLHHAEFSTKKKLITHLYNERIERLKKCNLDLPLDQLLKYYK